MAAHTPREGSPPSGGHALDLREWVRAFGVRAGSPRCLRWDPSLDDEDGTGVRVALVDSGLLWSHPMFEGARIQGRDFTGSGGLGDLTGHGTRNASLIIGQGRGWIRGLCPGCELLFGKALGSDESESSVRAVARGIRWAVAKGADVLVLPFGRRRGSAVVTREIRRAVDRGCTVFAAGGNRGPDEISFPAWLPQVQAVTGIGSDGKPLPICCARDEVNLYAPGHEVPAVDPDGYTTLSGSSPATVLAAGLAALRLASTRSIRHG